MDPSFQSHGDRQVFLNGCHRGRKELRRPLGDLRKLLIFRIELRDYWNKLENSAFYAMVELERAGRVHWFLWALVSSVTLVFDPAFTFSGTAALLRDSLGRLFSIVSGGGLDFWIALVVSVAVWSITLSVRLSTETFKQREQLKVAPADSAEALELLQSIRHKKFVRSGWAVVLTAFLAAAAVSDLLSIQAYSELNTVSASLKVSSVPERDLSSTATLAQMLQLVTPYGVTAMLHFLILFLPLPRSGPFLPYPCAPNRTEQNLRRVDQMIGDTGKLVFEIIIASSNRAVRDQLLTILGEQERIVVEVAVGKKVFANSFGTNGAPSNNPPTNN